VNRTHGVTYSSIESGYQLISGRLPDVCIVEDECLLLGMSVFRILASVGGTVTKLPMEIATGIVLKA
jgi:hypothetical protein